MLSIFSGKLHELVTAIERIGSTKAIILVNDLQTIDKYISDVKGFVDFRRKEMKLYTGEGQEILFFVIKSSGDIDKLSGLSVDTIGYENNSLRGLSLIQSEYIEKRMRSVLRECI